MGKYSIDGATLNEIANAIRAVMDTTDGITPEAMTHIIRTSMYSKGENKFDINNLLITGRNLAETNANNRPKAENNELLSGGVAGDTMGATVAVYVQPGDIIEFSTHAEGETGTISFCVSQHLEDGLMVGYKKLAEMSVKAGDDRSQVFAVPEGYTLFGFAFFSATRYGLRLSNISIRKRLDAAAEQAAAYSIMMGDTV